MKRNKRQYMSAGALLAAAWITSGSSAFGQSITYQLSRSDTTSNLAGISNVNVVSDGSQSGTLLSFNILALVSGGANVSDNTFDFGEFKVSSSASGAAAPLKGNLTFTPSPQFQSSSGATALYIIPTNNATSLVGTEVGDPIHATSPTDDASTVLVNLGTGTTATAQGIETIGATQYAVFNLGTLTFATTQQAVLGQADTISVVPVSGVGTQYYPHKAFIDNGVSNSRVLNNLQSAGSLDLNIVTRSIGDINGDGNVDGTDLGLLINRYGIDAAKGDIVNAASSADFNGDSKVDGLDLGLLINHYGSTGVLSVLQAPPLNVTVVPEPSSLALLVAAPLMAMRRRRNSK